VYSARSGVFPKGVHWISLNVIDFSGLLHWLPTRNLILKSVSYRALITVTRPYYVSFHFGSSRVYVPDTLNCVVDAFFKGFCLGTVLLLLAELRARAVFFPKWTLFDALQYITHISTSSSPFASKTCAIDLYGESAGAGGFNHFLRGHIQVDMSFRPVFNITFISFAIIIVAA
jgi:hypothetical protein